jgi:hypothetical protein
MVMLSEPLKITAEEMLAAQYEAHRINMIRDINIARDKARADGTMRYEPIDGLPGQYFEVFSIPR